MDFPEVLKSLRKESGLSQEELADKIYVSRSAIARWENGLGVPSSENLEELCKFFDVRLTDLGFAEKKEEPKKKGKGMWILFAVSVFLIVLSIVISITAFTSYNKRLKAESQKEQQQVRLMNEAYSNVAYISNIQMRVSSYYRSSSSPAVLYEPDTVPASTLVMCNHVPKAESYEISFSTDPTEVEAYFCYVDEDYHPVSTSSLCALSKSEWFGGGSFYKNLTITGNSVSFSYDTPMAAIILNVSYDDVVVEYCIIIKEA